MIFLAVVCSMPVFDGSDWSSTLGWVFSNCIFPMALVNSNEPELTVAERQLVF